MAGSHLKILLWKNWLLWKRNCCCSVMEIILPVLMCCFFFLFRSSLDTTAIDEKSYLQMKIPEAGKREQPQFYPYTIWPGYDYPENLPNYDASTYNGYDFTHVNYFPWIKNCVNNTRDGIRERFDRNGKIALAPENDYTRALADIITQHKWDDQNYEVQYFKDEDDIQDYVTSDDYGEDLCFGVSFQESTGDQIKYSIHYNTTSPNPDQHDVPETLLDDYKGYQVEYIEFFFQPWVESGFIQVQHWIDNIILREKTGNPNAGVKFQATSARTQSYNKDEMVDILKGQMATYYVLPIIITFLRMSYGLLIEKEKKIKEGMKIMGLKDSSFYLSWLIHYFIVYTITSLLVALVSVASVWPNSSFILVFLWYLFYCCTLLFQSLFITTFFSKAKTGNIIAMVFYLALYMSSLSVDSTASFGSKAAISIFSQNAVNFGADTFLLSETKSGGIGFSNAGDEIERYSISISFLMMFINMLIFGLLAFYFDQVFPNEFGKKKHPLFCFPCLLRNKQNGRKVSNSNDNLDQDKKEVQKELGDIEGANLKNQEAVDQVLLDKKHNNEAIVIQNISKIYPNKKKAVNNLSVDMYKDHITCLLGHNGAGKTSTISMLIGMQEFTEGQASAFGLDVETQMPELRQIMGVCPQHDILFDMLTCEEHLYLYAEFKGVPKDKIEAEVTQMLQDVDLLYKRKDYSKSLSGGQKRRLSVAIAFIGGSKLIYLDEPTSGMDTSARRFIWEMLQKYKQDRIVVLTTHFMDEADFLGDRIAIMGQGELLCCGSSAYLKSQFGVGYNLTIVKADTSVQSQPILDYVAEKIPNSKLVSDISAEIQFQLKMEDVSKFQDLFNGLDAKKAELNFQNYGISITTMEEVFLQVADEGKNALQENKSQKNSKLFLEQEKAKEKQQIEDNEKFDNFDLNAIRITNTFALFMTHFYALSRKRIQYFKRDYKGFLCEILLPSLIVVFGLLIASGDTVVNSPDNTLDVVELYENKPKVLYSGNPTDATTTEMSSILGEIEDQFEFTYYQPEGTTLKAQIESWDLENFENQEEDNRGGFFFKSIDLASQAMDYFLEITTVNRDAFPIFVNRLNTAFIREMTGNSNFDIEVTVAMFKNTKKIEEIEGVADGFISSIIFSIALSFIPASMIAFTVKEREDQIKHQQLVSGVSLPAYWFSNLAIDLLKYFIPTCVFCILMIAAFNIETFSENSETLTATILTFVLYGWAMVPFSYLFGFAFKQYGNAQVSSFFIHFIAGGIFPLVFFILRVIPSTADVAKVLAWFLRLLPSFCFGESLLNLGSRKLFATIEGKDDDYEVFDISICLGSILMLGITGLVYLILIFLYEKLQSKGIITRLMSKEDAIPYTPKPLDGDVEDEQQLIEKTEPKDYTVRVNKLRKVYKLPGNRYNEAVDQISFGIKNGECFTLLGINGAGKTSTFKILSGDIISTSGEAHIQGFDVKTDMQNARKYIGYCPQFDALLENLTSQEHLELYAAIKGIPRDKIKDLVNQKILEMELSDFRNVCAGTYSGGNKRKLSVAIAMLGNPPICFLDEPSTGMDPKARRYMWNVISRISTKRKKSSIILTTHSMEEAEALSTKIAIMVTGQLKCIGSIQHIKSKFGKGYEVELKLVLPSKEQLNQCIQDSGISATTVYRKDNYQQLLPNDLAKLGAPEIMEKLVNSGECIVLFNSINSIGGLKIQTLVQYILIERMGEKVKQFISEHFGQYSIIEHFQSFYRFKIETEIPTGKIFGAFESNKKDLNLASYNVKQATIEQIFNLFAKDQIQTVTKQMEQEQRQQAYQDNNQKQIEIQAQAQE